MDWWMTISIDGVACCAIGALCYLIGGKCDRDAEKLMSVIRVDKLKDLGELLNAASKVVPLVVAVYGWGSVRTPRSNARDGTSRIRICGAKWASGFQLFFGGEVFKALKETENHEKLEEDGLKLLEVMKRAYVLPIGAHLTVVGEVVKDYKGAIVIEKPQGGPFYVSRGYTLDELIGNLETWSIFWKSASVTFTVIGVCLIATHAFIEGSTCVKRMWKRFLASPAEEDKNENHGQNKKQRTGEKGRTATDDHACRICYKRKYDSAFVPCGHMCCCLGCSKQLNQCHLCRAKIRQVLKVYP